MVCFLVALCHVKARSLTHLYGACLIAWPADTETGPGTELLERKARANMIIRLFRNLGFRRVGRTSFFARALQDKDHPSFKLSAEDDPEALSDYPEVREVLSDLHGPATSQYCTSPSFGTSPAD